MQKEGMRIGNEYRIMLILLNKDTLLSKIALFSFTPIQDTLSFARYFDNPKTGRFMHKGRIQNRAGCEHKEQLEVGPTTSCLVAR